MGVTSQQMAMFTEEEESAFLIRHGKRLSKMIALTICRGFVSGWLFTPFVAFCLRQFSDDRFMYLLYQKYVRLLDARSFRYIISSVEGYNPMRPTLSQKRKGS